MGRSVRGEVVVVEEQRRFNVSCGEGVEGSVAEGKEQDAVSVGGVDARPFPVAPCSRGVLRQALVRDDDQEFSLDAGGLITHDPDAQRLNVVA